MVYQRRGNRREKRRGNTRCLGCGYGCGQFGVEYITDEDNGSGRGYCSLDCYTSAKVTGRNWQARPGSGGGDPLYNQRYRGTTASGYGQPQPWPTGLLVDAPPSPQPWRGRTRSLSQSSMSWRTAGSSSTGNLSSADDSSSQESLAADWHMGESEDGDTVVENGGGGGGGGGSIVGMANAANSGGGCRGGVDVAAGGLPAPAQGDAQSNRRYDRNGRVGGGGGTVATGTVCGRGQGIKNYNNDKTSSDAGDPRGGGGGSGVCQPRHGQTCSRVESTGRTAIAGAGIGVSVEHRTSNSTRGGVITGGGNGQRGEQLPPLAPVPVAPIPRLGAFPAQRRVHGSAAAGGGGGRRVEIRTVAFATPPVRTSTTSSRPPSSNEGCGGGATKNCKKSFSPSLSAAASKGNSKPDGGDAAEGEIKPAREATVKDGDNGKTSAMEHRSAAVSEAGGTAEKAYGNGGDLNPRAVAAQDDEATADFTEAREEPKFVGHHVLEACGPAISVPTRVVVRQWRRLFFA